MASDNVELLRQAVEAINGRDAERLIGLVADDFEWITPVMSGEPRIYKGREGIHEFMREASAFERFEARIEELRDLGDRALMLGEVKRSSDPEEQASTLATVIYLADGRITRIQTYRSANEAWTAAGLGRPRP